MIINGHIGNHKAIILNEERIQEMIKLLEKYCDGIKIEIKTKRKSQILFESVEEFLQYDNYGNNKIDAMYIAGYKDSLKVIGIEFSQSLSPFIFISYEKTVECSYTFHCQEDEKLFIEEFNIFITKCKAPYWIMSKITPLGVVFWICASLSLYGLFNDDFHMPGFKWSYLLIVFMLAVLCWFLLYAVDRYIINNVFPPIVFAIGEEIHRFEKYKNLRTNLFWVIIVGIIVGVITTIICNTFLK